MGMITSARGVSTIIGHEGVRLKAYLDSKGIPTIGVGTIRYPNGVRVKLGDTCTLAQAMSWLTKDLNQFEKAINTDVTVPLSQTQFDALADFVYNIGGYAFHTSTLLKKLNRKDYVGAGAEFVKWTKQPELRRRRDRETALFNKGIYPS